MSQNNTVSSRTFPKANFVEFVGNDNLGTFRYLEIASLIAIYFGVISPL